MFKIINHNDSGGMHIRIKRIEPSSTTVKVKEAVSNVVQLFGINKKKGDTLEKTPTEDKSLNNECEICGKEFDTVRGLRLHKIKKHR
jgi:hypothetical protein